MLYWGPSNQTSYTAPDSPLWFPSRLAAASTTYSFDISKALNGDIPISGTVATAPSGTGELVVSSFTYASNSLFVTPTGGQPGRIYTYEFLITGLSGQVYPFTVMQGTVKVLCGDIAQVAPNPGFGTPMSWTSSGPVLLVATGLVGTGTGQASALLLPAFTNVISSCPPGTGFILNAFLGEGTQVVQNQDPSNNATIYPPVGAQIIAGGVTLAVNAPFIVGFGGAQISFTTTASATLWSGA